MRQHNLKKKKGFSWNAEILSTFFFFFLERMCHFSARSDGKGNPGARGSVVCMGWSQALAVGRPRTFNPPKGVFWSLYNRISPAPPENRSSRCVAKQQSVVCGAWDEYKSFAVFAGWILKPRPGGDRAFFSLCSISSTLGLCSVKWCQSVRVSPSEIV